MTRFLAMCLLAAVSASCSSNKKKEPPPNMEREKLVMMDTDRAFSTMSEQVGMKAAFMDYIDSNGVLLRPNQWPIVGADAVDYLSRLSDRDYTMKWEPAGAGIALSGELGYTYGTYQVTVKTGGPDSVFYGTYVNVWKKQENGSWKFVLDSGNEGVGEEPVGEGAELYREEP